VFGQASKEAATIETCSVCPVLQTNVWGDNPSAVWFPVAGTMQFSQVNHETREYAGNLSQVIFKRVGIYGVPSYGNWVQSGDPLHPEQPDCMFLKEATFDTRRSVERACKTSGDCPNSRYHVCDEATGKCVASQCDQGKRWDGKTGKMLDTGTPACPAGKICELQVDTDDWYYGAHVEHAFTTGACVTPCTGTCPGDKACKESAMVKGGKAMICQPR
jgi:hypothetical protein